MRSIKFALFILIINLATSCTNNFGSEVKQVDIARVNLMPNIPSPLKIIDWRQKAISFDSLAFKHDADLATGPLIWIDNTGRNNGLPTFGLYTAVKDIRQGKEHNNGEFHESLNSFAAIIGASLVGIDKSKQDGWNYVKMAQSYFNTGNNWNIMMNNTCPDVALLGGGYGRDWWYDILPNNLYYAICDLYPNVEGADEIQRTIAEQFVKSDSILNGNYDYTYFDFAQMKGMNNWIPKQQDATGGYANLLYSAYKKYGDERYLKHAKNALSVLDNQTESRFYEILLPLGILTASQMNAEQGTSYDIHKMLNWVFDGCTSKDGRYGWGIIAERWGDYDMHGLQGSITDRGGYAFLMNSIKIAWPLVPMVKYQPQYARTIGKWMLNNVNASRFCFPMELPDNNQVLPEKKDLFDNIIAYEGVRKLDDYFHPHLYDQSPVATGDGPKWNVNNPKESVFSLYSTAPVGMFGAMVNKTNDEAILALDCNVTDFYAERKFPTYLIYNPYLENKEIKLAVAEGSDIFDIVKKEYVARNISASTMIDMEADQAKVLVVLPGGTNITKKEGKLFANGSVISYQ